ncbi:MAG: RHS repeat-associated core domain-containing protein, partial [Chloroflexi bacterium]|nr:RHS repeat-associated core domain-containing protein [Chloroflexota bacterium]MBU1749580.1 RHS repeat-associated core domain-containing protein [Chloroflexota bacterium]
SNGTSTDGLVYLLGDHLGSTSLTLDPVDGDKLTELRYKAYGQTRYASGTTSTARRFTGQIEDDYINLYQMGDRWYNAELGRWISPDPIIPEPGNPQSLNRYSYVVNNPLRYTDPTGHLPEASVHGEPAYDEPPPPQVPPSPPDGDPATPFVVGWEWLTGQGPRRHEFRDGDPFLEMLKKHEHIEDVREVIVGKVLTYNYRSGAEPNDLQGLEGVPKYFRDYTVLLTFGQTGNLAVTFLGSYTLYYYVVSVDRDAGTAEILFHVSNASSLASATRPPVIGYMPFWQDHIAPVINGIVSGSGPASTVTQAFWWTETVSFK